MPCWIKDLKVRFEALNLLKETGKTLSDISKVIAFLSRTLIAQEIEH
jgi:hypothetical protein